jgi:5-methylcytosine-specific restriction endonuclease McrA
LTRQILGPGVRRIDRPTRQDHQVGYAASRRAYDARRRRNVRSGETRSFIEVLQRDPCGLHCEDCHRQIAADHIVPLEAGGSDDWTNMGAACRSGNASKGNRSLLHFLLER